MLILSHKNDLTNHCFMPPYCLYLGLTFVISLADASE